MAMRYEDATKLYQDTLKKITKDEKSWKYFLKSACKNYRLPFADMVMVYAQRPNATAVLEMEDWNKRYGLWVKSGSKGIAVFDSEYEDNARLKYYFDVSDTRQTEAFRPVPIWAMQKKYEEEVIKALSDHFGALEDERTLPAAILSAVNNMVEDTIEDYQSDLHYAITDSYLDGLDEQTIALTYQTALTSSIAYATLSRCGIYADDYISEESLRLVTQFNTAESLNALGVPANDMTQAVIGEIRKTVLMLIRDENRTIVKKDSTGYNKAVKEIAKAERSHEDETRISTGGRIPDTQPDIETRASNEPWEVWNDEKEISQETSSNPVHQPIDKPILESASIEHRPDSHAEERSDDETNDGKDGHERTAEGIQSDGMGSQNESNRGNDTRSNLKRTDLQLNTELQAGTSYEIPAFFTLDEYEELLKYDKFRTHKNKDIQAVFQFYDDKGHRLTYVKESFNKTFIETVYQEQRMGFYPDEKRNALKVWKGSYLNPEQVAYVSWENVTAFIEDMIERNVYLSIPIKPLPTTQEQQLNLFDIAPLEPSQNKKESRPFAMPQYIMDAVLSEGTEEKDSKKKIAVFFSLDRPIEENVTFLQDLYHKGSNGFIINQRSVSYTWDTDGMQIAWGKGIVSSFHNQQLSWEDAAKGIRSLFDNGRYMSQEELGDCKTFEYREMAMKLLYMCQDMDFNESDHMQELREYFYMGFVNAPPKIANLLEDTAFYERTMNALYEFNTDYQQNKYLIRNSGKQYAPDKIIPFMERLTMPHIEFQTIDYRDPAYVYFVTQDTIDTLVSNEHQVNQKYDTYAFFLNHADKKERIKYVKNIWGDSGSGNYNSDSKGLLIKTGSYNKPYAQQLLKWKEVTDRINYLITNNKYLNIEEINGMEDYELKTIVSEIERFFYPLSFNNLRPYRIDEDYFEKGNVLHEFIKDNRNLEHVLDLMQIALNNIDESASNYENMAKCYSDVRQYHNGTYTLFNQKKEPKTALYEPVLDTRHSIAIILNELMNDVERYEDSEVKPSIKDTESMLRDIAGLEDTIKYLNEVIYKGSTLSIVVKAITLREELSMLYAERKGCDFTQENEITSTFHPVISQIEPHYNTGDFVFIHFEKQDIYGSIEIIEDDTVILQPFSNDFIDGVGMSTDIEINKKDFETLLVHDGRNGYLYDQQRPLLRAESLPNEIAVEEESLGYQNYLALKRIAPLVLSGDAVSMTFANTQDNSNVKISANLEIFTIREESEKSYQQYILNRVDFEELNIRKIDLNGDLEVLDLDTDDEPVYYEIELQMNEEANDFIKSIDEKGYQLQRVHIQRIGIDRNVIYDMDGNISEFDGTENELKWFKETYSDEPQDKISTLLPEVEKQGNIPSQKNDNIRLEGDKVIVEESVEIRPPTTTNIAIHKLYPEVVDNKRNTFKITDYDLGVGGAKEKYKANVTAIQLLKQLEQEQRLATPEEQTILSHYVGWGSLPDAFDETKKNWSHEYQELKTLLNDMEYKAARLSTLTAFYTPPIVIESIYNKLTDMGLNDGNILEPSCGVGNFIGMQPEAMDCHFYGVELDEVSGKIAQQLYQKATIAIQGFEKIEMPDNLFDAVIGNVPYGQIPIFDSRYNQQKFMIHDYFFAKALDKVKVGGVVIFLTSKFTMDKKNRSVRKYIAQRADLLGAIRLPDNTFSANAGTDVTSDILILQKHERPLIDEPAWLDIAVDENEVMMNSYFIEHPEMVLGNMVNESSQYGMSTACKPFEGADLKEQLRNVMNDIHATLTSKPALFVDEEDKSIPADPTIRNFSYCIVDGNIYYRENSRMYPYKTTKTGDNRIRGMLQIRDSMRRLIDLQMNDCPTSAITKEQQLLHTLYDTFTIKYNLLNSRANKLAFQEDSSYSLISSLEVLNEDRSLKKKADIFDKRTIKPRRLVTTVKTASEALLVCMTEKGHIDFDFMTKIAGIEKTEIVKSLQGVIFPNPERMNETGEPLYETSDEYLSGDVREKLILARHASNKEPTLYHGNVEALIKVQPERIKAGDISVRLGTTWIPVEFYRDFMHELLDTPRWYKNDINILYLSSTQEWNVTKKSMDRGVKASKTFGTNRISGYKIIETSLNLRDVKIFDTVYEDGKEVRLLNKKETAIAQDKQDIIKSKFVEWIWKDPERREQLCDIYNEKYNSIRNRTYDGSTLSFTGMNPDISLRKHQVDAIARILYGGNTLLAHTVGAGKTFEMIAAGMESKRLGFSSKPLYVVPNNIIGDFASDFYRLYPSANVLVATTETLAKTNRHKFFSRIATGDWDGIIITHSQFIKMPVSFERQCALIHRQVDEIVNNIEMCKQQDGERFTIKQLEKMKQKLEGKLEKLNDSSKKDDILCFEQLGIDMLFVDEADLFKNLFIYSKMRNVAGISQTDSQRASDLFMKTQYLDELTNYHGVVFATGTAISNSMAELYTMQRYLQSNTLKKYGLGSFDAWASTFGETLTAMELAPEGSGFKMKTRFSKFFNLPELMTMFREVADIQTADMLDLPVPTAHFKVSSVPASEEQKNMITALGERAEKVRNREVQPYEDNMLKITSEGRKVALEQRLINPLLPENEDSKVNACVDNAYALWNESSTIAGTQLIFCDLSTPTKDSKNLVDIIENEDGNQLETNLAFTNVYEELKKKLIIKGIPSEQIAYIHDAKTDIQRKDLFGLVRQGNVRILIGSTSKMGAGTNVQDLIVALHDLDCPWRPRDLEQRRGRGIRQGNINASVYVYRYVTEGTFDSYLYQTIEKKQQFISQILTGKTPQRTMEEIDEAVLNYAEIKAIACGDPKIMERCNLELEVNKLGVLQASYRNQKFELQDSILKKFPRAIAEYEEKIKCLKEDIKLRDSQPLPEDEQFVGMTLDSVLYENKADAGNILIELCKRNTTAEPLFIGEYRSFQLHVYFSSLTSEFVLSLDHKMSHPIIVGTDKLGNITRMNNALNGMEKQLEETKQNLSSTLTQLETAKIEVERPFEREDELQEKTKRLAKLTIELKLDQKDPSIIGEDEGEVDMDDGTVKKARARER